MPPTLDTTSSVENLERFSEIIIETLKELSMNRQPLSSSFLCQALSRRQAVVDLFSRSDRAKAPAAGPSSHEELAQEELKSQMQVLRVHKEHALTEIAWLKEHMASLQSFTKRAVPVLTVLCNVSEDDPLFEPLEQLKVRILGDAEPEELESSLSRLKNALVQRDLALPKPEGGETSLWGKWFKRKEAEPARAGLGESHLKQLQRAYLNILREFHTDLGQDYMERFTRIQQQIRGSTGFDDLIALGEEIGGLIQAYVRIMAEEKNQITELVTEIGSSMVELESQFLSSLSHTSEVHRANTTFNSLLEGQMEEIRHSMGVSKTLADFKVFLVSRLASIRTALETKSREDQLRQEALNREVDLLKGNLNNMRREIDQAQERSKSLEVESLMDPLTGIPNVRAYERRLKEELQRYLRYGQHFSLLLFDVDYFKRVNDNYGHWAGDKCLKEIIKRIKPALRESDFLARYGGEEFIILMPGTGVTSAHTVAERLCALVEKTRFHYQGRQIPLTISIGVTEVRRDDHEPENIFTRVDKAMYEAKHRGRNRVVSL